MVSRTDYQEAASGRACWLQGCVLGHQTFGLYFLSAQQCRLRSHCLPGLLPRGVWLSDWPPDQKVCEEPWQPFVLLSPAWLWGSRSHTTVLLVAPACPESSTNDFIQSQFPISTGPDYISTHFSPRERKSLLATRKSHTLGIAKIHMGLYLVTCNRGTSPFSCYGAPDRWYPRTDPNHIYRPIYKDT